MTVAFADDDTTNDNTICTEDCAGEWGGDGVLDDCGVCDNDATNDNTTCRQDCAGEWGGDAREDNCGSAITTQPTTIAHAVWIAQVNGAVIQS